MTSALRLRRVLAALVASFAVLVAAAGAARAADWVGLGDSYAAGPLIPNRAAVHVDRDEPAAVRLALGEHEGRLAADRRQRHRLHRHPQELRDLQPVRPSVPRSLRGRRGRPDRRLDQRGRAEGRGGAPRHPPTLSLGARAGRQLRGHPAPSGYGCWPQVPLGYSDVPYLRAKEQQRLVDDYTPSTAYSACRSAGTRWVEPLVPGNLAAPLHPNARGEAGVAGVVAPAAG